MLHPIMKTASLLLAACLAASSLHAQSEDGWVSLFNGKDFDGWEQHSGAAEYRVEDGAIVADETADRFFSPDGPEAFRRYAGERGGD